MGKADINWEKEQSEAYIAKKRKQMLSGKSLKRIWAQICFGIAIGIFGVFWGRGEILQLLYPLGMVYLSLFFGTKVLFWFAWMGVAFGSLQLVPMQSWAILAGSAAIQLTLGRSIKKEAILQKALLGGFVMCLASVFYGLSQGGLVFYYVVGVVETALMILFSLFGQKAVLFFWKRRERPVPTKEEIYSLCFLLACGLGGVSASSNPIIGEGLLACLVAYTIGFCAWREGAGSASAASMLLGFVLYLSGGISQVWFLTFAISGLVSGLFGRYGKIFTSLGLLVTPLIFLFYHDGMPTETYLFTGWLVGVLLLLCTPKKFLLTYSKVLWNEENWKNQYIWKKEMVEADLRRFAKAFCTLAKKFGEDREELGKRDVPAMVNELTDSVCKGCGLAYYCWKEEVNQTYPMVARVLENESLDRGFSSTVFSESFANTCVRLDLFTAKANRILEMERYKLQWQDKLMENRKLMCEQTAAMGEIMEGIGRNIEKEVVFYDEKAKDLLEVCQTEEIAVSHVSVTEDMKQNRKQVQLTISACGGVGLCRQKILHLVEDVLGCKVISSVTNVCKREKKECLLTYLEESPFVLSTATSSLSATDLVSGDAATVLHTERGTSFMAVSDGMGKGVEAAKESVAAIELLEQFLESGFDGELAVKLINSALLFGSEGDTYATLDICSMDLFTGKGEFLKMGAVASYIYRGDRLFSVQAHSLPAGILQQVEVTKQEMSFKDGDLIFMMTDGITDVFGGEKELENWLRAKLKLRPMYNPKDLADLLLIGAKKILETSPIAKVRADDMMVLVGRFWKRL